MEKLQGPINPCLIAEDLEVGWLEEFISCTAAGLKFEDPYNYFSEEQGVRNYGADVTQCTLPTLEDKIPLLQMLQAVEHHQQQQQQQQQPFMQFEPANFQFLLRLQHQLAESCVSTNLNTNHNINTNGNSSDMIIMDLHSPGLKSEITDAHQIGEIAVEKCNSSSRSKRTQVLKTSTSCSTPKEKRKRKRPAKNKEEVEAQRMTHIAVERNRRHQMNEHLSALRSLMPPSYVQRGDQASIIGAAIDFVKELEQMLQSLQAQKRMRQCEENGDVSVSLSSTSSSSNLHVSNMFFASPSSSSFHQQLRNPLHSNEEGNGNAEEGVRKSNEEYSAEKKSSLADIEVVVIQNHVNLKIQCQRRPGQLIRAIVAFEELRLTVLHLNITSMHSLVHYSFNLKIEEDCKLGTADEVARAVHQILSLINLT